MPADSQSGDPQTTQLPVTAGPCGSPSVTTDVRCATPRPLTGAATFIAKMAEVDRVLREANWLLRLQGGKAIKCGWKVEAFLRGK